MTNMFDEFMLIHKQLNPSYEAPRLGIEDVQTYQAQLNLSRRVMATQVAPNKYVLEVTNIKFIIYRNILNFSFSLMKLQMHIAHFSSKSHSRDQTTDRAMNLHRKRKSYRKHRPFQTVPDTNVKVHLSNFVPSYLMSTVSSYIVFWNNKI